MIFALLVNPKDGVLYYGYKFGSTPVLSGVAIKDAATREIGIGYFEQDYLSESLLSTFATGLPRVHTPDGVKITGGGRGTVLYTALCAAAHLVKEGDLEIAMPAVGDGISSTRDSSRSASADAWWERAVYTYRIAERVNVFVANEHVHQNVIADAYPFKRATDTSLVVALVDPRAGVKTLQSLRPEQVTRADTAALLAVNYASLWRPSLGLDDARRERIFECLLGIGKRFGMSKAELRNMYIRYAARADRRGARDNPAVPGSEVARADAEVAKLRTKLGWDVFSADPEAQ